MARPVIALLTDFGTRDHYAGTMKGVALGICPDATLVDISHDLPAHDVLGAALELAAAYRYFPTGTIFLVVVDPGVGSGRRGIAAEAGDYKFVAPDNGVLTAVLDEHPPKRIVELAALGRSAGAIHRLDIPKPQVAADRIDGQVVRVDRFGNLITNIDRRTFDKVADGPLDIRVGSHAVPRVVSTYADVAPGEVCALFGSTDHLEIATNGASAAASLDLGRGASVHVARRA